MKIYSKNDLISYIKNPKLMDYLEEGLILSAQGKVLEAPWSGLYFPKSDGEVHVKSAASLDGNFYVVKIASGFFQNPSQTSLRTLKV